MPFQEKPFKMKIFSNVPSRVMNLNKSKPFNKEKDNMDILIDNVQEEINKMN